MEKLALKTTYISPIKLTAIIPAAELITIVKNRDTVKNIRVNNQASGGGTSNSVPFTVKAITITSISPKEVWSGSRDTILTVDGVNFIKGSVVLFDKSDLETTYVSSEQLKAQIPSSFLKEPGKFKIRVINPELGSPSSLPVPLLVKSPTITNISPSSVGLKSPDTTITINGTGFLKTAKAYFYSGLKELIPIYLSVEYISENQIKVVIPAMHLLFLREIDIWVANPIPGDENLNSIVPEPATLSVTETELIIIKNKTNARTGEFGFAVHGPSTFYKAIKSDYFDYGIFNSSVEPGTTYSITEIIQKDGWKLVSVSCKVDGKPTGKPNNEYGIDNVTVIRGKKTICTFDNKKDNPDLIITEIFPEEVAVHGEDATVTVYGHKFSKNSQARAFINYPDTSNLSTTFKSSTELTIVVPKEYLREKKDDVDYLFIDIIDLKTKEISNSKKLKLLDPNQASNLPVPVVQVRNDILLLQKFLNGNGFTVAKKGPGSPGNETGFFGSLTKEALRNFQEANGLPKSSPSSGMYGPWTKAIIKERYGGLTGI